MNILIINQPPFNRGDESAHKALIRAFVSKIPNANIKVLFASQNTESIRQYSVIAPHVEYVEDPIGVITYGDLYFHRFLLDDFPFWHLCGKFRKYKKIYQWADLVVCAPGGICMGGFQDWDHMVHLELAKAYKKKLVYYGRSFGPFYENTRKAKAFKKRSMKMLHYFSFLSIRDHQTELLAQDLNLSYTTTVDTAFLDNPNIKLPYEVKALIGNEPYMVFVPNYLRWHYSYKENITHDEVVEFYIKLAKELLLINPQLNILMLPQLFCGREYALSDVTFFRELADIINDKRIIVLPDCYGSDIQQVIIRDSKFVLGARYHSIVFAINQGVPFIALSYEHKIAGLLETLNISENCVNFTSVIGSNETEKKCINAIKDIIPKLGNAEKPKIKAKEIANNCLEYFIRTNI